MGNECGVSVAEVGCRGFAGQSLCRASSKESQRHSEKSHQGH